MKQTLDQLAVIERRDRWIRRLSQLFFAALFALLLTGSVVGGLAFILDQRETTQRDSRAAATRRIDMLTKTVHEQSTQIANLQGQVGALTTAQAALIEQLRQHDLVPVVRAVATPRKTADPTPQPRAGTSPSPGPHPTSSPRPPSPSPSPSPSPCTVPNPAPNPLVGRCVIR